jgi:hypothetical protein
MFLTIIPRPVRRIPDQPPEIEMSIEIECNSLQSIEQKRKNKAILAWAQQNGVGTKPGTSRPFLAHLETARGFGVPHPGRSKKGGALTKKRLAKTPVTLGTLLKAKIDGQKSS